MIGSFLVKLIVYASLFSMIFWVLTFAGKWLYSNKYYNYKLNFYECGFKSLTKVKINYNINYLLLLLFFLIYDGEFLILIPFSLNFSLLYFESFLCLCFFLFWLFSTLIIDYIYQALDWQP